jgi:hypothetical protein
MKETQMRRASKPERRYAKAIAPGMCRSLGVSLTAKFLRYGEVIEINECGHEVLRLPMNITVHDNP